jgi:hypothetical protein
MYSRCLFCARDLGRNGAVGAFPVGRRLAYDAAKGRLWVVCPSCARWNLTPLEERWEAVEQAERLFRGARLRVATDEIGLAEVAGGASLVRVGRPLRPEFAAWRYGTVLRRRRVRRALRAAPAAGVGAVGGSAVLIAQLVVAPQLILQLGGGLAGVIAGCVALSKVGDALGALEVRTRRALLGSAASVVARVTAGGAEPLVVRRGHLAESRLRRGAGGALALTLRHDAGVAEFEGDEARRVAGLVAPAVNADGAGDAQVRHAVEAIAVRGGPDGYLRAITAWVERATRPMPGPPRRWTPEATVPDDGLFGLTGVQRLAFEMALHEESERRALDGELAALEQAWRDAETVAAIADRLAVPGHVERALGRLRGRR